MLWCDVRSRKKTWNVSVRNSIMEDPRTLRALLFFWSHKDLSDLRWMPSVHSTGMERYWFCTLIQKWNTGPNLMEIFLFETVDLISIHRFPLLANDVGVYFFFCYTIRPVFDTSATAKYCFVRQLVKIPLNNWHDLDCNAQKSQ